MRLLALPLSNAFALNHTWVGPTVVQNRNAAAKLELAHALDVQTVVITGSVPSISFGSGGFYIGFSEVAINFQGGNGVNNAIASGVAKALKLTHSCTNPALSEEAKSTTGISDMTDRWLAASQMFSTVQGANLLGMAGKAYNGIGLAIGGVQDLRSL